MASIYRRGRQLWGRVQRQGKDLRQSLKTTSRAIAEKRFRDWLDELDRVAWGEKPRRSFDDAMLRFINEHLPTLKPRSAERYLVSIEKLTDCLEGKWLDRIGSAELAEFEAKRRRDGVTRKGREGALVVTPISPATIRRDLSCLSSFFSCCIDWEYLEFNPVPPYMRRRKKRGALKESPPRRRYLTQEEETRILAQASPHVREAMAFAVDTGLRLEEQFSLVRAQLTATRVKVTTASKNSKAREVPLLPRSARFSAQLPLRLKTPFVFVNPDTGTRYNNLEKGLKAACRRAGVEDVRWHDLRRTCGCRLLQDHRLSMEHVSKWLGHSSIQVTERIYAFLEVEHLEERIAAAKKGASDE